MKTIRSLLSVALLLPVLAAGPAALAAPACVDPASERGVGGTGSPAAGVGGTGAPVAGIGGTGAPAAGIGGTGAMAGVGGTGAPEGGIGGTGAVADSGMGGTGIVGTITGFASICVNGLEVHYDEATPMHENGQPANIRRLAVGQVVAIDAVPSARGFEARQVVIVHALAGPVTRNDARGLEVMGQPVRVAPGAVNPDARALPAGTPVRVSGLRDADGTVVATRVERDDGLQEHSAVGEARGGTLDGLAVRGRPLPATGTEALVRGRWTGRELVARELVEHPSRPFADRADRLVIEARVRRDDGRVRAGGFELRGDDGRVALDALASGERVRISGRRDGRDALRIERLERPGDALERRGRSGEDRAGARGEDSRSGSDEDRSGSSGPDDRSGSSGRDERGGREDRSGSSRDQRERIDRSGSSGRSDRPERIDRPDTDRSGRG